MSDRNGDGQQRRTPGVDEPRPPPRRFYKSADVRQDEAGFHVMLDGRPIRTPRKRVFVVPTRALAEAIAAEWNAQAETIDPQTMPLTRLVNTGIDGVGENRDEIIGAIAAFAGSDMLCYRADGPDGLVARQAEVWDPVLVWAEGELGGRWTTTTGLMPVAQPPETLARVETAARPFDDLSLGALHVMTALTGSALLALAHARGRLSAEEAWAAAHVDEDWQIAQWGEDWEAAERRSRRLAEMQAASRLLALLRLA